MLKSIIGFLYSFILKKYADTISEKIKDMDNLEIPGTEKSKSVAESIKKLREDWPNWLINLVVELGVAYLRLRMGEKIK